MNNLTELKYVVKKLKPNICIVTETHCTDEITNNELKMNGFNIKRCNSNNTRTGGTAIYVENGLKTIESNNYVDGIWISSTEIEVRDNGTIVLAAVYLSPSVNKCIIIEKFEKWLEEIDPLKNIIVCGDFNIDIGKKTYESNMLNNIVADYGLKHYINIPTRVAQYFTANGIRESSTIIDLCISNMKKNLKVNVLGENQISDHNMIEINIKCNPVKKTQQIKKIETLYNYSAENLWNEISKWQYKWEHIREDDYNVKVNWYLENLSETAMKFIKLKTIKTQNEFFDDELEQMRQRKNILYKISKISNVNEKWFDYKKYKNEYKRTIKEKQYECIQRKFDKVNGDSRGTWQILKSILYEEKCDVDFVEESNNIYENKYDIVEAFNNFFIDSISKINNDIEQLNYKNVIKFDTQEKFELKPISYNKLKSTIRTIKNSRDIFGISNTVLLDSTVQIGYILIELINNSIENGIFPEVLKQTVITPIRKKAGTIKINEFRPINVLPCLEKVLEKIVHEQMFNYIEKNNILTERQSGFRNGFSCESALNLVLHEWKNGIEDGNEILAVFLDFQRAFETIDRKILLQKLEQYGFAHLTLKWFNSYLENRSQVVKLDNVISIPLNNNIGVPQGSILGPLLFILYINDLEKHLKWCKINMFADDTLIYIETKNIHEGIEKLNFDLNNIYNALCQNKLKLNVDKTKFLVISNNNNLDRMPLSININNQVVKPSDQVKYLGIIIDKKLNGKSNVDYVCKKMGTKANALSRLRNKLNYGQKIMIYKSIIEPHLTYCSSILYLNSEICLNRLQKIQNRCMRNILNCKKDIGQIELTQALSILDVGDLSTYNTMIVIFKISKNMYPKYLSITHNNENVRKATLRNADDFQLTRMMKKNTQNSLFYRGVKHFNSLPNEIKKENNINIFKKRLKKIFEISKIM